MSLLKRTPSALFVAVAWSCLVGHNPAEGQRSVLEVNWSVIGGTAPTFDAPVLRPVLLAGDSEGVATYDMGDNSLRALLPDGSLRVCECGSYDRGSA